MKKLSLVLILALAATGLAQATIIVSLVNSAPSGGNFAFNYRADLSGDERLDPTQTDSMHATCPGPGGTKIVCNPAGTFFTIYDFPGLQSISAPPAFWGVISGLTGLTPSTINGGTIDSGSIANVTFFYTGPVVHGNGVGVQFSGFQIISSFGGLNANGNFSSQSTKDTGDAAGNTDQATGPVTVPVGTVPEPASLLLIGAGLVGLAAMRRRARG